jgi:EmrB/QacA subfamily drug resistance transporter
LTINDRDNYKWWVLFTVSLGAISVSLDSSVLIVCLPVFAKVFHTDSAVIGWVNIAYLTTSQSLGLILGKIGDAKGRKRVYMTGLAFYTVGILACAVAQGPMQLIIARAVQGVGAATGWTLTMAIAVAVFPAEERGKALGILAGAYSVGLVVGPVVGGLILDALGWRAVFWTRAPIALAALLLAWTIIKEQKSAISCFRLDVAGAAMLFGFLSSLMFFLNYAGLLGITRPSVLALGATSTAFLIAFLFIEMTCEQPIIDLDLFRKRLFTAAVFSGGLQTASTGAAIFLIPFYLSAALGYSSSAVGLFIALLATPLLVVSPISGKLSDRIGSRFLAALGISVLLVAFFGLSHLGINPAYWQLTVAVGLVGTGMAIFQPPNNSAVIGSVSREDLGTASAVVSTVRNIGSSTAIALGSAAFSSHQAYHVGRLTHLRGGLDSPALIKKLAAAASFHDTLTIALVAGTAAFVMSLIRGRAKER